MAKFIIRHNTGYGDSYEIIEAKDVREAEQAAYESWRDEVESNADYDAESYSKELAVEYGLEDDEESEEE